MHRKEAALAGGDNGKAFEPGKSAESRLIRYVSGLDSDTVMPPDGEGERLSAEQVGLLRAWIDRGAKWPAEADIIGPTTSSHWAYKRPGRPAVPKVKLCAWWAATNCFSVVAGLSGLTASVIELIDGKAIGSSSAMANPGLAIRLWLMATPVALNRMV